MVTIGMRLFWAQIDLFELIRSNDGHQEKIHPIDTTIIEQTGIKIT
jgi:hypothetical protein